MFKAYRFLYPIIYIIKKSRNLSALSCRLTQITGKSKHPIHPKHLIKGKKPWYLHNIGRKDYVLDLGCGNGQCALKIAPICKKAVGLDLNDSHLEIARQTAKEKNIKNVQFIKCDLEKRLSIKNNSYSKIICQDILEHLYKRKKFLLEVKRILKPKGIVFITVPNKNTSWKKLQKKIGLNFYTDPDHKIEYSLKEIKKTLFKLNFEILSIKPIVYDTPLGGFIDLVGGVSLRLYDKLIIWKENKVKNNMKESIGFKIKATKHFKIKNSKIPT